MFWNTTDGVTVIDSFEDQDLSEYSDDTADVSIGTGQVFDGGYAAEVVGDGTFNTIYSTPGDGLGTYFSKGQQARLYFYITGGLGYPYFLFGLNNGNQDCYRLSVTTGSSPHALRLQVYDNSSFQSKPIETDLSADLSTGGWYYFDVQWDDGSTFGGSDNDITPAVVDNSSGTTLASATANDSTHATNSGLGLGAGSSLTSGESIWCDYLHLPTA